MSLRTTSQNRVSNFTFTNSRTGGGGAGTGSVSITSIVVTDSGFNNLDDSSVGTSNSYIKIIGTGFSSSANVFVSGSQVSSVNVTYVNSTEIRVTLPSLSLGNTNIFVFNPDYSGAIWAPGINVSGFPEYTQTSYTTVTPLEVSVQLLATGDAPLTYALQAGSSLPSGCSLSSSGLITGTTVDGTYQFTVIVSDAQNQSFQQQLTLTITSTDEYFNRTVLAINADANTFVTDASSNNFAITVNGDTKPSAFSPYNTNWSNEFDGTGDSLQITGSAALSSTGDFTIEGWGYFRSISNYTGIFSMRNATNAAGASINILNNGNFDFSVSPGGEYLATAVPLNRWFHVALVRSGSSTNNISCYLDGVRVAQFTSNSQANGGSNVAIIGRYYVDGTDQYHANGFISNVRYVNGTALYSGATITVPTSPLTAVTNTAILTCQSNRIRDNSTNAFAIQKNGDTKVSAFGPFTETDITTGSGYFDGTGDYLTAPSNTAFTLGSSGDFTIECWFYLTASPSNYAPLMTTWTNSTNSYANRWGLSFYDGKLSWFTDPGNLGVADSSNIALNTWIHVAVVRSGSTITMYKNGVSLGTQTTAQAYTTDNTLSIGYIAGGAYITGYISNARIVKGTAVYTSAFTPPTVSLTAIANTSLLTLQTRQPVNNHTFIDTSGNNIAVTRNGNVTQGSFSPFSPAGWSNYFDGSGDFLTLSGTSATNFNGVDWTFECWFYKTALSGGNDSIIQSTAGTNNWIPYFGLGLNNDLTIAASINAAAYNSSQTYSLNAWNHIAMVRSGGVVKVYLNGTATSISVTSDITSTNLTFWFGKTDNSPGLGTYLYYFNGYLSNLRLVKGTAVYTSNFTPSTTPLTAIANTSLLTCQSNRFIDNSTNNFTITRNGDTKVVNFSPFKPTAAYSLVTHGGSIYFDGTGDFLDIASSSGFAFGTGDFTVEGWFYLNRTGEHRLVDFTSSRLLYITPNTQMSYYLSGDAILSSTLVANAWYHFALSRSSGSTKLFLNGVQAGSTYSDSTNFAAVAPTIGRDRTSTYFHQGYMSDLCVSRTARYTSNFSVPTTTISLIPNASLILKSNPAIVDVSSRNVMETVGGARIISSTRKYGTGSMYFDGTDDRLTFPASSFFAFPGDFTIEFWSYNQDVSGSTQRGWLQTSDTAGGLKTTYTSGISIAQSISGGGNLGVNIMGTALNSSAGVIIANQWQHIAVTRASGVVKLFVDGTQVATSTISTSITGQNLVIGGYYNTTYLYNGYIDDLRITNGYARYTANFTAPTATFLVQ